MNLYLNYYLFKEIIPINYLQLITLLIAFFIIGYQVGKNSIIATYRGIKSQPMLPAIELPIRMKDQEVQVALFSEQNRQVPSISQQNSNLKRQQTMKGKNQVFEEEMLQEKVGLELKKVQSTSFFEMRLEPSLNSKFMRKIQKHQIVTDYEIDSTSKTQTQIVLFSKENDSKLSEASSLLQVTTYKDYNMNLPSPISQRKFISLNKLNEEWRNQAVTPWILQNGRFSKLFKVEKMIGKGSYGCVYKAFNILQQRQYAIKKVGMKGKVKIGQLMNEVFIISKYNHPNIVNYYSCWIELATLDDTIQFSSLIPEIKEINSVKSLTELAYIESDSAFTFEKSDKQNSKFQENLVQSQQIVAFQPKKTNLIQLYTLHIQMQICQISLHAYLRMRNKVDYTESFFILEQLIAGLHYLHSNRIVHRDLKPANILLCKKNKSVKIGDFGLAALVQQAKDTILGERVGTPQYMAPQLKGNLKIEKQNLYLLDMFSLGVIYYELLHDLKECTEHERHERLWNLKENKITMDSKQLREQKKLIKVLTKLKGRPSIVQLKQKKQYVQLKKKYST